MKQHYCLHSTTLACAAAVSLIFTGCQTGAHKSSSGSSRETLGSIERLDPALDQLIDVNAPIEVLASGFNWAEGPVWLSDEQTLLFSDVPENTIFQWNEQEGLGIYLRPSGLTASTPRGGEPGSNGLTLDHDGNLIICQHGDRRVAKLNDNAIYTTVVGEYDGKRFNSPNDLDFHSNGDLYFTDPPYGLIGKNDDPKKEIPFNGVYRISKDGTLTLLDREVTYPNGIALSPGEQTLYVAVSDPNRPIILSYRLKADGTLDMASKKVLFDATALRAAGGKGLPDGLKVDVDGNLWATGPGGVLIISPEGRHLGTIQTGEATANCGWGEDGSVLYITADMHLLRVQTKTRGDLPGTM